jgi:hypothetical protein
MRKRVELQLEDGRVTTGVMASDESFGLMGAFMLTSPKGSVLKIVSSGTDIETGWEHVSVSLDNRCPNWPEMCWVKDLFWEKYEMVVQYHPPESEYVNHHPYCLHMWRHVNLPFPMPPSLLVGPKTIR